MMSNTNFGSVVTPQGTSEKQRLLRKYAVGGKVETVLHEYKTGKLRSGSKRGPKVTSRKQAIAIALSEQRKAKGYAAGGSVGWWDQLQQEIQDLSPHSPLRDGLK